MRVVLSMPQAEESLMCAAARAAYYVLLAVGIAALGYAGYSVLDGYRYQHAEMRYFEASLVGSRATSVNVTRDESRGSVVAPVTGAAQSAPLPSSGIARLARRSELQPVPNGGVLGEIEVPRIDLKAIVVEGDSSQQLRRAVGHLPESALPGEPGNVALAAHRDSLFRPLRKIRNGDAIIVRTREDEVEYRVTWFAVVEPGAVQFIQRTPEPSLTLVTCYPFSYLGSAPKRFIVRAIQTSPQPQRTPADPSGRSSRER